MELSSFSSMKLVCQQRPRGASIDWPELGLRFRLLDSHWEDYNRL